MEFLIFKRRYIDHVKSLFSVKAEVSANLKTFQYAEIEISLNLAARPVKIDVNSAL